MTFLLLFSSKKKENLACQVGKKTFNFVLPKNIHTLSLPPTLKEYLGLNLG